MAVNDFKHVFVAFVAAPMTLWLCFLFCPTASTTSGNRISFTSLIAISLVWVSVCVCVGAKVDVVAICVSKLVFE